jgi:ribose transport system substrate-binding protein
MRKSAIRTLLLASALVAAAGAGGITSAAEVDGATDTTAPAGTAADGGEAPSLEFSGPNGETPTPASELELTSEEVEQVRAGGYTAALVWHENSAFIQAVESGVREQFEELGVEVIASTSAEFDAAQQAANIETVLANDPDIIVTIAVDPTTAAEAYRPAVEQGVKIVVLTTPPAGYTAGEEIVGIVTGELTAYGKAAAEMLGEALGGEGQVGWIFHDADFWFTNQRDQAFKDWLAYLYPNMEVVDEAGFSDPARTEDIANAMITQNPDLNGIYVAWATAADGVLAALRAAGRDDVAVVTNDLDENLALDMVQGGNVVGVVANPAVDIGRNLAIMAGYGVLEKEAPEMAVAAPVATTSDNLAEGWQAEFAEDPPQELLDAAEG